MFEALPITVVSHSAEETEAFGAALGERVLSSGQTDGFIALYGDLGAGKTAFVRGMISVLIPGASVTSPTYTIVNEYRGKVRFCHFDFYRIESEDDLESIGFYDYRNCLMAGEWCEKIPFALPSRYLRLTIEKIGETERKITLEEVG